MMRFTNSLIIIISVGSQQPSLSAQS